MRLIDADALYEKASDLEAQALDYTVKISNDEEKREEWLRWSAILAERSAFKHDVNDAPTIEPGPRWMPCDESLPPSGAACFVTVECSGEKSTCVSTFDHGTGWSNLEYGERVVSWMPLPKPWGGDEE